MKDIENQDFINKSNNSKCLEFWFNKHPYVFFINLVVIYINYEYLY